MNIKEAYNLLGVSEDISDEDLKKEHKKLVIKYHPDIFKSDPEKLKTINSAYQYIQEYRTNPQKFQQQGSPFQNGHNPFGDDIMSFIRQSMGGQGRVQHRQHQVQPINVNVNISFKESVLGTDKELTYNKSIKCHTCDGAGEERIKNDCKHCDGFGKKIQRQGNMVFQQQCNQCYGRGVKEKECDKCGSNGMINAETRVNVHIPPGNSATLRLQGAGHYAGSAMFGDAHTDVFVNVNVEKDPDLTLEGNDVVSHMKISLVEALTGTSKQIRTIYDTRIIDIPAKAKNKDEIALQGCGVRIRNGAQRVVLDVDYGNNTDALIKFLKKKEKN
jgi:molecular chaperone DnaJ